MDPHTLWGTVGGIGWMKRPLMQVIRVTRDRKRVKFAKGKDIERIDRVASDTQGRQSRWTQGRDDARIQLKGKRRKFQPTLGER